MPRGRCLWRLLLLRAGFVLWLVYYIGRRSAVIASGGRMRNLTAMAAGLSLATIVSGCGPTPDTDHMKSVKSQAVAPAIAITPSTHTLDCAEPVTVDMSAKALLAKFGKDARKGDIAGAEGQVAKGVILYPDDPSRRLEVTYWDVAQTAVSNVALGEKASAWTAPGGLKLGAGLADVQSANGKPFELSGFDWDYGGYVTNLSSGKLSKLPGGCVLGVRFDLPANAQNVPDSLMGDHALMSDNAQLQKAAPRVVELSVGWPLPKGVKVAGDGTGE
ncbi:MAG: hypothetical protein ACXU8U_01435 [Asticcacaulis sp.]